MRSFDEIKDLIAADPWKPESIGTQAEQSVHRAIKYWISPDPTTHEVRLAKRIADVFLDGRVYEIQTRSFAAIAAKVEALLGSYPVTVVYPVVRKKTVYAIGADGTVGRGRVSPRRQGVATLLVELAGMKNLVGHSRLDFLALVFDAAEYRSADRARKGHRSGRVDLYPHGVPEPVRFTDAASFRALIPAGLPAPFTAKAFAKALKLRAADGAKALSFLRFAGIAEMTGKDGRAYLYRIVPGNAAPFSSIV